MRLQRGLRAWWPWKVNGTMTWRCVLFKTLCKSGTRVGVFQISSPLHSRRWLYFFLLLQWHKYRTPRKRLGITGWYFVAITDHQSWNENRKGQGHGSRPDCCDSGWSPLPRHRRYKPSALREAGMRGKAGTRRRASICCDRGHHMGNPQSCISLHLN